MKITKENLKKLIREVTAAELAYRDAVKRDRKRNPQAGPHYRRSEHEGDPGLFDRVGTNIKRSIERMYDPDAPAPGDITGPTPVKDPRPVRVASTDPTSPNHLRKKINALHASGRISRETKIAARRALHGKGGKYDPEMGVEAAMAILRDAGVRIDLKEASKVASDTLEEMVRGEIAKQRLTKIVREEFEAVLSEADKDPIGIKTRINSYLDHVLGENPNLQYGGIALSNDPDCGPTLGPHDFVVRLTQSETKAEGVEAALSESDAMKDKAARAVWELYSQDKAARPDVRHPDGEAKEKRLTAKRQKKRLATGKARDDG